MPCPDAGRIRLWAWTSCAFASLTLWTSRPFLHFESLSLSLSLSFSLILQGDAGFNDDEDDWGAPVPSKSADKNGSAKAIKAAPAKAADDDWDW
jgi:hypothetical protein